MSADNQIAATLAAALLQQPDGMTEKEHPKRAALAVATYFQCLDALAAETKKRSKSSSSPLNI
ncbi:hypothetical protein KMZ29_14665 [Bradyrhizobium sediminis]|uniref:Uncharacterized protein n=1 Tax=Bradyrhizobium sediminis TaxID=2840469 RepID=A0A975RKU6_9BRAD|nr:hypothetical protein [Bradyrhizobium sediminis]QWG11024.1 hypothetical protein KMZ29_14665 [Bradyrhizobium sediminis]